MVTQKVYLGPQELKLLLTLEEAGKKTSTIKDVKAILRTSDASVKNVIYRLSKKGRITEVERGKYVLSPAKSGLAGLWVEHPFLVVPSLIDNYYVAFWSALNYWGMTEQIPKVMFIATTNRKRTVEYGNQKFKFVKLSKKKFFGCVQERIEDQVFNISSKEKTIIDCLAHLEYCGGIVEITKAIWNVREEMDWDKLLRMTEKIGINSIARRLGYILELLEIRRDVAQRLLKKKFIGFRWLDPMAEKNVLEYSKKWGLKVNVSKDKMLGWRSY